MPTIRDIARKKRLSGFDRLPRLNQQNTCLTLPKKRLKRSSSNRITSPIVWRVI